jgi:response regulator RpfG family c-di-GMP phosphodiesterase
MAGKEHTPAQADRTAPPTILVVASDLKLLKLLDMGLSLEFACTVFTLDSGRSAETAVQRITPDLLILDEHLLDRRAAVLGTQLHRVTGLERVPTLLINVAVPFQSESQGYPTRLLGTSWKLEELYAAVHALLGHPS